MQLIFASYKFLLQYLHFLVELIHQYLFRLFQDKIWIKQLFIMKIIVKMKKAIKQ